ncbi:MAG: ABC transporter permease [Halospina sp.]
MDIRDALRVSREGHDSQLYLIAPQGDIELPEGYAVREFSLAPPTGELADSFLLNLDALGLLVLLITGLLIRSVHRLGLVQREASFELLYRFGVLPGRIRQLLALELVVLTAVGVPPGLWLGASLAELLGAGFGQALGSLFDVTLYAESFGSLPWRAAGVMAALVLTVCLLEWVLPRQPAMVSKYARLGASALLLAGALGVILATELTWVFAGTAMVFAGVGLLTPPLLAAVAEHWAGRSGTAQSVADPMRRWRARELSVMFRELALPVVALQFSMAAVLAVHALVTTFENTFEQWLGQRLAADVYIEVPQGSDSAAAVRQLNGLDGLGAWHLVARGKARVRTQEPDRDADPVTADLMALAPITGLVSDWTLLSSAEHPWRELARGGVMINEQLARRHDVEVGSSLEVTIAATRMRTDVVGIYADYGRPVAEVLLHDDTLPTAFTPRTESFSVNKGGLSMALIRDRLADTWGSPDLQMRDNASIRALASRIFDQTFLLTRAISALTLVLAAVALLIMTWVFFTTRVWYFRLLGVWGLQERRVRSQLRWLSVSLTLTITVAALPLGIWLTWVLVNRINPLAFGWSLPMDLYPVFWLELGLMAGVAGLLVARLMRRQLERDVNGERP